MIEVKIDDVAFTESLDAGHPECRCSRCLKKIKENEFILRCWTTNKNDKVDENSKEYRYCQECQTGMGIIAMGPEPEWFDPDPY